MQFEYPAKSKADANERTHNVLFVHVRAWTIKKQIRKVTAEFYLLSLFNNSFSNSDLTLW